MVRVRGLRVRVYGFRFWIKELFQYRDNNQQRLLYAFQGLYVHLLSPLALASEAESQAASPSRDYSMLVSVL